MADVFSRAKRSAIMAQVRSENTRPELVVRKLVHSLGYRFRLNQRTLPGKPDIVLARHRKIILVHGCFWHGHSRCVRASLPSTNLMFWQSKIDGNKVRDANVRRMLTKEGWKVLVIWQCQTRNTEELTTRLKKFIEAN
jgi:DNA mismatch endonuclease (patch repair protein)